MSKKKIIGIIVVCIIAIFVVIAVATAPSEPTPTPSTPPTATETISTPSIPTGPSMGNVNESLIYIAGGSTSRLGHSIQYRFNWGDGNYSEWSSSTSATHSWPSPGNYLVQAQARSSVNCGILSSWSSSKSVTINPPKAIIIKYSVTITNERKGWLWTMKADPGYTYLVVNLDIENDGYDSFTTGQGLFYVVVKQVKYDTGYYYPEKDALKSVDLLDGGKISGKIAFEIPEVVLSAGYQFGYRRESWEPYNIKWIGQ